MTTERRSPDCPRAASEAVLYSSDEMQHQDVDGFERHLAACADCSEAVSEHRQIATLMSALPKRRPSAAVFEALSAAARRMADEIAAEPWYARIRETIERALEPRLVPAAGWALAAAFALFAAGTGLHDGFVRGTSEPAILAWEYDMPDDDSDASSAPGDVLTESYWDQDEALGMDLIVLSSDIDDLSSTIDEF